VIVDSFRFLPRSFRPLYENRGAFRGEEHAVWAPFEKRLADSRIALLTSAGIYLKGSQPGFDLDGERERPEWGDPTWRVIPSATRPDQVGVAHLHINDEDLVADPEIALPAHRLRELVAEGIVGSEAANHLAVMGYQDRGLDDWRRTTAPAIVDHLRAEQADGLVLAPT
jgi:D-proline reductase (dithiol) PrdB